MLHITGTNLNFEREALSAPFGFKGGYLSELWQTVALLECDSGSLGLGLGVQSTLWCDPRVFSAYSESAGNALMLAMTAHALREIKGETFESPMTLNECLLPLVHEYGVRATGFPDLHPAFAMNALLPVDNAAWMLYAAERGLQSFDDIVPVSAGAALSHRHRRVVSIPVVGYGASIESVVNLVERGFYFLKIKIGSDPAGDGDLAKMVAWDRGRMDAIHQAIGHLDAPGSETGRVMYYLDANQRYDNRERLMQLLDALSASGALDHVVMIEEPFAASDTTDVRGIPVTVAADESAANVYGARARLDLGYGALALKPQAKSVSAAFRIVELAHARGVPCFCADLTVNPVMADWNKCFAARMAPLKGLDCGALEVNGWQNYARWKTMQSWHPCAGSDWSEPRDGAYSLDDDFYAQSGGIFTPSEHYLELVKR